MPAKSIWRDPFANADDNMYTPTPPPAGRKKSFPIPLDALSAREIDEATQNASRAGQYRRKTITLLPGQIDYLQAVAEKENVGLLALYRWLIDQGLQAYENGARPVVEQKIVRGEPQKGHPTSLP